MTTFEECQIANILYSEIKWIVADETRAFDKYFDMPIVNMEHTVEQLRAFYVWCRGIDGGTPIRVVYEKLVEALNKLSEYGESPDKLAGWITSVQDTHTSTEQSRAQWKGYFKSVVDSVNENTIAHVNKEIIRLTQSYMQLVDKPDSEFFKLSLQSEKHWLHSSQNRSNFDDYLWKESYADFDMSPVGLANKYYTTKLQRNWWKQEGASVSNDIKEEMFEGLVNIGAKNSDGWYWDETHQIDLVFSKTNLD